MQPIGNLIKKDKLRRFTEEEYLAAKRLKEQALALENGADPNCPICRGLGKVRRADGSGKIDPCACVRLLALPYTERYGLFEDEAKNLAWQDLLDLNHTGKAVQAIQEALQTGRGWIYLYGDFGVGKTRILKTGVACSLQANIPAIYIRMSSAIDRLAESFDPQTPEAESSIMDWFVSVPVLALDEVDKMRITDYRKDRRFLLLDSRYERACNENLFSVTLMAGNDNPDRLDPSIFDRIRDGRFTVIEMRGASLRPGME